MVPALSPGEEVVAVDSRPAEIGALVVLEHPNQPDFWLIKRRVEPPQRIPVTEAWVLSDNLAATRADSRSFGPIRKDSLMPVIQRLDSDSFEEACELLADEDTALAAALDEHGQPAFWRRSPGFACLTLLILEQQVSLESGAAMYRRLVEAADEVTPNSIERLGPDGLRRLGVTRQKTAYLMDLAASVLSGEISMEALEDAPIDMARSALLGLNGVGPWTADAYLLSALGHVDVFPVGDRALQVGAGEVLGMSRPPTPEELELLSEQWGPIRAVAARIIWHAYLSSRGRSEPDVALPRAAPSDVRRVSQP